MKTIQFPFKLDALAIGVALAFAAGTPLTAQAQTAAPPVAAASPVATQTPQQIVQRIADQLGGALKGHREEYKKDRPALVALINKVLLPHFDASYAAILVLGRYARQATPAQINAFQKAFYDALIDRYADGLIDYREGRVTILPSRGDVDGGRRAVVRSEVTLDDGKKVSVNYVFRRAEDGQWKAFDVVIEGISYIASYRSQVGEEIRRTSLDSLIARLQHEGGKAISSMKKQQG